MATNIRFGVEFEMVVQPKEGFLDDVDVLYDNPTKAVHEYIRGIFQDAGIPVYSGDDDMENEEQPIFKMDRHLRP